MPRNATAAYVAALSNPNLYPCILISLTLANGVANFWTGYQTIPFNGINFSGVGSLLSVSTIEDGSDVNARGCSISLSGIDPVMVAAAMTEMQTGLPVTIWLGLLELDNGLPVLIQDPVVAFQGRTDQPTIEVDEKSATITLALESNLLDMNTPVPYRYTNQDQQRFYPGDLGFMWVNSIQQIAIYWDQDITSSGNP